MLTAAWCFVPPNQSPNSTWKSLETAVVAVSSSRVRLAQACCTWVCKPASRICVYQHLGQQHEVHVVCIVYSVMISAVCCSDGLVLLSQEAMVDLLLNFRSASQPHALAPPMYRFRTEYTGLSRQQQITECALETGCSVHQLKVFIGLEQLSPEEESAMATFLAAKVSFMCDVCTDTSSPVWQDTFNSLLEAATMEAAAAGDPCAAAAYLVDTVGVAFASANRYSVAFSQAAQGSLSKWMGFDVQSLFSVHPDQGSGTLEGAASAAAPSPAEYDTLPSQLQRMLQQGADTRRIPGLLVCYMINHMFMCGVAPAEVFLPVSHLVHWALGVSAEATIQSKSTPAQPSNSAQNAACSDIPSLNDRWLHTCAMAVRYGFLAGCAPWGGDPVLQRPVTALRVTPPTHSATPAVPAATSSAVAAATGGEQPSTASGDQLKRALLQDLVKRARAQMRFTVMSRCEMEDQYFGWSGISQAQLHAASLRLALPLLDPQGGESQTPAGAMSSGDSAKLHSAQAVSMLLPVTSQQGGPTPRQWLAALRGAGIEAPLKAGDPPPGSPMMPGGSEPPDEDYTLQWQAVDVTRLRALQRLAAGPAPPTLSGGASSTPPPTGSSSSSSCTEAALDDALAMWLVLAVSLEQGGLLDPEGADCTPPAPPSTAPSVAAGLLPICLRRGCHLDWEQPLHLARQAVLLSCFGVPAEEREELGLQDAAAPPLGDEKSSPPPWAQLRLRIRSQVEQFSEVPQWLPPPLSTQGEAPPGASSSTAKLPSAVKLAMQALEGKRSHDALHLPCSCGCGDLVCMP